MKPISLELHNSSDKSLYIQLYDYLKDEITCGNMAAGEKLPSLRSVSKTLAISITTAEMAYNQLLVEGYIISRPQSGYYVAKLSVASAGVPSAVETLDFDSYPFEEARYKYDLSSFDFVKWKKCMSRVLNEYSSLLLYESDPQGEKVLRFEISKYVYSSRGVICTPDQIVISAGTQQLTNHLSRIMRRMSINHVATEDPGYLPVQNIFRDHGFAITKIPVASDGIAIEKLPVNIPSAVYVSPSNQFPTGSVMPVGRRYQLLDWAWANNSIILEDDYDSELRYFGRPVPALQGLDKNSNVVYFGSFSSTLFPAIKISYMVLPKKMAEIFSQIKSDYDQTCSKEEQLTLAMFMEKGYYYTGIRRLRNLYAQKLQAALAAFGRYAAGFVTPLNTSSGINITLRVTTKKRPEELCSKAASISLHVAPVASLTDQDTAALIFYYNQIPLGEIDSSIREMIRIWQE
jgi:GntR family transcriptional regulator/MocR family aminotransferase